MKRNTSKPLFIALILSCVAIAGNAEIIRKGNPAHERAEPRVPNLIDRQYLVQLQDERLEGTELDAAIDELAARYEARVLSRYAYAFPGFLGEMSPEAAAAMKGDPLVAIVAKNRVVKIADEPKGREFEVPSEIMAMSTAQPNPPWSLDRVDQRSLPFDFRYWYNNTASSVHIYVVDTGIRTTHSEFEGRVSLSRSRNFALGDPDPTNIGDCHNHGTFVASQAAGKTYGVAKKATLHSIRVFNCQGFATFGTIVDGLNWILTPGNLDRPAVVNLSFNYTLNEDPEGVIMFENAVTRLATERRVPVVVSAGNSPPLSSLDAGQNTPARLMVNGVVVVGATDSIDRRSPGSCYGGSVDLYAPGQDVTGASNASDTAVWTTSGTSFAAPLVSGYAALILQLNPALTGGEVEQTINSTATANKVQNVPDPSHRRLLFTNP